MAVDLSDFKRVVVHCTLVVVLLPEALYFVKMLYNTRKVDLRSRFTTSATQHKEYMSSKGQGQKPTTNIQNLL